jgi:hypothetical protein
MITVPIEVDIDAIFLMRYFDAPEWLGNEVLNSKVTLNYKSKRWKLTRAFIKTISLASTSNRCRNLTITDYLQVLLHWHYHRLQIDRHQPCECSTDPEVKFNTSVDGFCLILVEVYGIVDCLEDVPVVSTP